MEKIYSGIRQIAAKYHIDKVILFGSRARGDFSPKSDIDIAVYFTDGYFNKDRAAFCSEITDGVPTLYELNLFCIDDKTDDRLLKNIKEDGVTLYMKEKKLDQYRKAVAKTKEASIAYAHNDNDLFRDALVQRFEFTFELAWKSIKEYLESEGFAEVNSPRSVLKKAFSLDLIESEDWLNMLEDRNLTAHTYQESVAVSISERIQGGYVQLFEELEKKLSERAHSL